MENLWSDSNVSFYEYIVRSVRNPLLTSVNGEGFFYDTMMLKNKIKKRKKKSISTDVVAVEYTVLNAHVISFESGKSTRYDTV